MRSFRPTRALLGALGLLLSGRLAAQDCRGVPATVVHAMGSRFELNDGSMNYTGEAGLHLGGARGMYANYATADIGEPRSKVFSYGARLYRQYGSAALTACVVSGYQQGYAYLVHVDGNSLNYQERTSTIPIAFPIGYQLRPLRGTRLSIFVTPQYLFQSSSGKLYDRGDTLSYAEHPSAYATEAGASVRFGPIFARLSWFKRADRDADIILGGGIAW